MVQLQLHYDGQLLDQMIGEEEEVVVGVTVLLLLTLLVISGCWCPQASAVRSEALGARQQHYADECSRQSAHRMMTAAVLLKLLSRHYCRK